MSINKTKNQGLQATFDKWLEQLDQVIEFQKNNKITTPQLRKEKYNIIEKFVRTFVPPDVTEDDISHFTTNLCDDEEFFNSVVRDIRHCSTGELVESITGNQESSATFTILPPPDLLDNADFDLVREVSYISNDNGVTWFAEA